MTLWLVQYLCPSRHCLVAAPYDGDITEPATIERALITTMEPAGFEHRCGLCGSRTLHFEHGKLKASTWEEALELLRGVQADQIRTRLEVERRRRDTN